MKAAIETRRFARVETLNAIMQQATSQTEITSKAMDVIVAARCEQFNKLQESGNVRELKAWFMHFVARIELGYNRAKIFYTYPMMDLFSAVDNLSNAAIHFGGTKSHHP